MDDQVQIERVLAMTIKKRAPSAPQKKHLLLSEVAARYLRDVEVTKEETTLKSYRHRVGVLVRLLADVCQLPYVLESSEKSQTIQPYGIIWIEFYNNCRYTHSIAKCCDTENHIISWAWFNLGQLYLTV